MIKKILLIIVSISTTTVVVAMDFQKRITDTPHNGESKVRKEHIVAILFSDYLQSGSYLNLINENNGDFTLNFSINKPKGLHHNVRYNLAYCEMPLISYIRCEGFDRKGLVDHFMKQARLKVISSPDHSVCGTLVCENTVQGLVGYFRFS